MRLKTFRIQNFRSILDTGFQELSPDNITAIIGQNESGKSSILEGLYAFDNDEITVDDIRNDGYPMVTCIYEITEDEVKEALIEYACDINALVKLIKAQNYTITFKRIRTEGKLDASTLQVEDKAIISYFSGIEEDIKTEPAPAVQNPEVPTVPIPKQEVIKEGKTLTIDTFCQEIYQSGPVITLFEDRSLLPAIIDLSDLKANKGVDGSIGAVNFLRITDLNIDELISHQTNERMIGDKIDKANKMISKDFQEYRSQVLGKQDKISIQLDVKNYDDTVAGKQGKSYLSFRIKDNNGKQRPMQRSKGVRRYISFFLTLKATAKTTNERVILIDEPGANLHAKAQKDILKILESEKDNLQLVYATHSPYLLDIDKVYRVLAVERKEVDDEKTVTQLFKFHELGGASHDTLFPLYTNMGVDISHQEVIKKKNNVLLEEISAFFYIKAFLLLLGITEELSLLPATGCSNIPLLSNLLTGRGIGFIVVVDDDARGRAVFGQLKKEHLMPDNRLIKIKECDGIEDLFSPKDFIQDMLGDPLPKKAVKNSQYVKDTKQSKPILARNFLLNVQEGKLSFDTLSKESQTNISKLVDDILESIKYT